MKYVLFRKLILLSAFFSFSKILNLQQFHMIYAHRPSKDGHSQKEIYSQAILQKGTLSLVAVK